MGAKLVHVGSIMGRPLRFFSSPLDDAGPDFPWVAVDDVYCALGFDDESRAHMLKFHHQPFQTVAIADEILTLAPDFELARTLNYLIGKGSMKRSIGHDYDRSCFKAMRKLARSRGYGDRMNTWVRGAMARWGDGEG
jgi:hypothetical protein